MGCWNGTCGISQVAILSGTKVKAVIIQNEVHMPEASGFCYDGGYASPVSFIIEGNYDDYGGVENINDSTQHSVTLFKLWWKDQIKEGNLTVNPDSYYDTEMCTQDGDYSKLSMQNIIKLIERNRVYIKKSFYNYQIERMDSEIVNMGIMLFHESIINNVQEALFKSDHYDITNFNAASLKTDCTYAVEDLFLLPKKSRSDDDIYEDLKALDKNHPTYNEDKTKLFDELKKSPSSLIRGWDATIRKLSKWNNMVAIFRGNEGADMNAFTNYFYKMQTITTDENKEQTVTMLSDMISLMTCMTSLRKVWQSHTGKGSQSFDECAYIGLSQGLQQVAFEPIKDMVGSEIDCIKTFQTLDSDRMISKGDVVEITDINWKTNSIFIEMSYGIERISMAEYNSNFEY